MAREDLIARTLKRDQIQLQLDAAYRRLHGMEQDIRESVGKGIPLDKILITINYIPIIEELIDNLESGLKAAEQEVEEARRILLERVKETRTLRKLREKEWMIYLAEWNREEQKIIDEIAITRYARKKS